MALNREQLLRYALENMNGDVRDADCNIIEYLLDHCAITIPAENRFFVSVNCAEIQQELYRIRRKKYKDELLHSSLNEGQEALAYTGSADFGHTTAEWECVINLGISGLKDRIELFAAKNPGSQAFYNRLLRVYKAALRFIKRAAEEASACGKNEMAAGLYNMAERAPGTLYEAMQTTLIYYTLQQFFDGSALRTLGRLDQLYYPFFVAEGEQVAKELIKDFLNEIDALNATANIPFALGGTDIAGNSLANPLSHLILEAYQNGETFNTKLHLLCAENTPEDLIKKALEGVCRGKNSITFMSDAKIIESLQKMGEDHEDAVRYHVVGCYECGGNGEITCSCNARVNLPKALELALNNGKDLLTHKQIGLENAGTFQTYDDLYAEFLRQLEYLCACARKVTDHYEAHYSKMHSAPILSGTYTSALEKGGDLYCDCSAKYNNSSLNALGLGTVTNSLAAIQKLVYEDQTLTLEQFKDILKSDWKNQEPLRIMIKNKFPKFGNGDEKTDAIAQSISNALSEMVNGKPNAKGGQYRLGLFSIDWRWEFGKKTAASADGRHAGEPLSQNTSATFGTDRNGATAHLLSVAKLDSSNTPNGSIADIDLHSTAVSGQKGLDALTATLKAYFKSGGFAVHYNILNVDTLKEATLHPENYPHLQVRLCGWNARFSTLSEQEKNDFIARSKR